MPAKKTKLPRGRPPTITMDQIVQTGISMGLPKLTFVGVAAKLGVSHMALYNHVKGLNALKTLVAETIFMGWRLPEPDGRLELSEHMHLLANTMWKLVDEHAGIAPYLLREDLITPAMMEKIQDHQQKLAITYGLTFAQSNWLSFTVTYHCIAIADTVLPVSNQADSKKSDHYITSENIISDEYAMGIRALISGALSILNQIE